MADIFISYANSDCELAQALAEILARHGWKVWWDRNIPPGKNFHEVIEQALVDARCVLVLWSEASLASQWVQNEAYEAVERNILIPAYLEHVKVKIAFKHLQTIDLVDWRAEPSQEPSVLLEALAEQLGDPESTMDGGSDHEPKIEPQTVASYVDRLRALIKTRLANSGIVHSRNYIPREIQWAPWTGAGKAGAISIEEILKDGSSFILYDNAGAGKTTYLHMLAKSLINGDPKKAPGYIPILLQARDFITAAEKALSRSDDLMDSIRELLGTSILEPFRSGSGEPISLPELRGLIDPSRWRMMLLIDGFDEIVFPDSKTSLKLLTAEQLLRLIQIIGSSLMVCITSRTADYELLRTLDFREISLRGLARDLVSEYIEANWPHLSEDREAVAAVFRERLASKPLYLRLLCQYYTDSESTVSPHSLNGIELLRAWIKGQIQENAKSQRWDYSGEIQIRCLRELAVTLCRRTTIGDSRLLTTCLETLAQAARRGRSEVANRHEQLAYLVKNFLVKDKMGSPRSSSAMKRYRFSYRDFRNFLVADDIHSRLASPEPGECDRLLLALEFPDVLGFLKGLYEAESSAARCRVKGRLIELISEAQIGYIPEDRKELMISSAALSLLIRIAEPDELGALDCRERCFQGVSGDGQNFRKLDFEKAVLRGSFFRGANLNEANLRGANLDDCDLRGARFRGCDLRGALLQNARLGQLISRSEELKKRLGKPTNLIGAKLEGSDWFNIRIILKGFFHFWTSMVLTEDQILLPTNRGNVLLLDLRTEKREFLDTGHSADVLDIDLDPSRRWLVTASRDNTVKIFSLEIESKTLVFKEDRILRSFPQHPRRVAFSRAGSWLGITDRAGFTYFFRTDSLWADQPPSFSTDLHHGPVMCLEAGTDVEGNDVFFTAGYDGRVFSHTAPEYQGEPWESVELADIQGMTPSEKGNEHTLRALALSPPDPLKPQEGLWLGDESGRLHYVDLETYELDTIELDGPRKPIFSIALHPHDERMALGMSNGAVRTYELSGDRSLSPASSFQMSCGDIVRSLRYTNDGCHLMAVTWAGLLEIRHTETDRTVFQFDSHDSYWDHKLDKKSILFGKKTGFEQIENLSHRYIEYLKRLR